MAKEVRLADSPIDLTGEDLATVLLSFYEERNEPLPIFEPPLSASILFVLGARIDDFLPDMACPVTILSSTGCEGSNIDEE